MFEVSVRKGRTTDFSVTINDADGAAVTIAAGDVVRVKVGRGDGATPDLDIDSVAASGNGSVVDASSNPVVVRVAQGDTSGLTPGCYTCEVAVVDDSETAPADAIKHAETGIVHILPALGGDVGTS